MSGNIHAMKKGAGALLALGLLMSAFISSVEAFGRGGGGFHGGGGFGGGFRGGVFVRGPYLYDPFWYDPFWGYYYPYYYAAYDAPYPYYYPSDYGSDYGPEAPPNWYCNDPSGYYPIVRSCRSQWVPVPASPPPPSALPPSR